MDPLEKQALKHNRIKIVLAVVGVSLSILGVGFERWSTLEQRREEAAMLNHIQKVSRMTEIGEEADSLIRETTHFSLSSATEILILHGALEAFLDDLNDEEGAGAARIEAFKPQVESILSQLEKGDEIGRWIKGIELEAIWRVKSSGFAPDFDLYFSQEVQRLSISVAQKGRHLVSSAIKYSPSDDDLDDFLAESAELARAIRKEIAATTDRPHLSQ